MSVLVSVHLCRMYFLFLHMPSQALEHTQGTSASRCGVHSPVCLVCRVSGDMGPVPQRKNRLDGEGQSGPRLICRVVLEPCSPVSSSGSSCCASLRPEALSRAIQCHHHRTTLDNKTWKCLLACIFGLQQVVARGVAIVPSELGPHVSPSQNVKWTPLGGGRFQAPTSILKNLGSLVD